MLGGLVLYVAGARQLLAPTLPLMFARFVWGLGSAGRGWRRWR